MPFYLYFVDPVLRGPTIGAIFMCVTAALMGVIIFLKRQSLLGEALSHAAYPGVILGIITAGLIDVDDQNEFIITLFIMIGAFITSFLGLYAIYFLENRFNIRSDSALCFILSSFFGIGITLASDVQFSFTHLYKNVQAYLFGQAATMTDSHIYIYGGLFFIILITLILFYKELKLVICNLEYANTLGIPAHLINSLIFFLTAISVVVGIRSVGVVLMSAMFVAPAVAARQFTHRLSIMLVLSSLFAALSAFIGTFLSNDLSDASIKLIIPTGPMIVLVASFFALFALLFASKKGILSKVYRFQKLKFQSRRENILKFMWRSNKKDISFQMIKAHQDISTLSLKVILFRLAHQGWIYQPKKNYYSLTKEGDVWAAKVVRLHRLWEVYLVDYLGLQAERVHKSAEEMEHIITEDLEKELTELLNDPQEDPHHQKIPPKESGL